MKPSKECWSLENCKLSRGRRSQARIIKLNLNSRNIKIVFWIGINVTIDGNKCLEPGRQGRWGGQRKEVMYMKDFGVSIWRHKDVQTLLWWLMHCSFSVQRTLESYTLNRSTVGWENSISKKMLWLKAEWVSLYWKLSSFAHWKRVLLEINPTSHPHSQSLAVLGGV